MVASNIMHKTSVGPTLSPTQLHYYRLIGLKNITKMTHFAGRAGVVEQYRNGTKLRELIHDESDFMHRIEHRSVENIVQILGPS